jgi:Xaa-Pro aminopeptidase
MAAGIMPLFYVFASGPQIMETHAVATNHILQPGEIVRIDMGGRMSSNNYLSDMARTAVVGEATAEQRSIYQRLSATQTAVFEGIRPGIPISDLYHICVQTYAREKLPFQMPHIGHGMGIGLHEAPMINAKNDTLLAEGMVLNIEPFVKLPERQETYHIEDLAVVTSDGCRLLTDPHPELISIPA